MDNQDKIITGLQDAIKFVKGEDVGARVTMYDTDWRNMIRKEGYHVMVPLNEYQMANLVDALAQASDSGDWWGETLMMVVAAMKILGIEKLHSNNGRDFTIEQIDRRDIRLPKPIT